MHTCVYTYIYLCLLICINKYQQYSIYHYHFPIGWDFLSSNRKKCIVSSIHYHIDMVLLKDALDLQIFLKSPIHYEVECKIYYVSKTNNRKIARVCNKIRFRTLRIFWNKFFSYYSKNLNHISKMKNYKINFSFVSEHCATFWTKKMKGEEVCMSLTH